MEYRKQNDIQKDFPIITGSLKIFLTIPTNTACCEQSFSCPMKLKSYFRTTMRQVKAKSQIEKKNIAFISTK